MKMKKLVSIVTVVLLVLGLMIPAFSTAETADVANDAVIYKWVNCENGKTLNLRQEPTTKSRSIFQLECGTQLEVIPQVGLPDGWIMVRVNARLQGYVMTKFLVNAKPGKYEITEREDNFRTVTPYFVTAKALNRNTTNSVGLRVKPNKTSAAIRRLQAGDRLQVIAVAKTWSKVLDPATGRTGYVANDYIIR